MDFHGVMFPLYPVLRRGMEMELLQHEFAPVNQCIASQNDFNSCPKIQNLCPLHGHVDVYNPRLLDGDGVVDVDG